MHKQWEMMLSTCHKHGTKKNSEYPIGIDPITFCIPVECSNHWATKERKNLSLFFFFVPSHAHDILITSFLFSSLSLKFTIFLYLSHMTISTLLILAVRRTHVIHEPCIWPSSPRVLRTSVVRASDRCMEDHRFHSSWGLRFFLCPMLVTCWLHFSFLPRGLNLTIFLFIAQTMFHKPFL